MSSLEELLLKDQNGQLNSFERKKFALKSDKYNTSALEDIKQAIDSLYADSLKVEPSDYYEARVLDAELDPTGIIPLEKGGESPGSLIKVIARIPELHSSIPLPDSQLCEGHRALAVIMHPIFYAEQGAETSVPKPGNIIKVSFPAGSGKYGRFVSILDDSESASFKTQVSPREAMENEETANNRTLADAQEDEQAESLEDSSKARRAAKRDARRVSREERRAARRSGR